MFKIFAFLLSLISLLTDSSSLVAQDRFKNNIDVSPEQSFTNEFSSFSSIELDYISSIVYGVVGGPEMEFYLSVQNNSDTTIEVQVIRNIVVIDTPLNWFCWDVCNIPETSESEAGIYISSESYVNEFSAHMESSCLGGVYPIEYCFFTESDYSDSVCVTTTFVIEGDHPGCTESNAINYNSQANISDFSCIFYPDPDWFSYTGNISINSEDLNTASEDLNTGHSFIITNDSFIEVENEPISIGDWIGIFYDNDGVILCADYYEWQGVNTNIFISSFDSISGQGPINGEDLFWQVWDASEGISWSMEVEYSSNFPNQNLFFETGQSLITYMSNITTVSHQNIQFPENWSMFSTFIITENMDISFVFDSIVDDLVIIKNNNGIVYLAEYQFNAIGNMLPGQGYQVKMNSSSELNFTGEFSKPYLFPIYLEDGWNMIGYLKQEPDYIDVIFSDLLAQDVIQIIKDSEGNAFMPEWNFDGIGFMEPSKGYQVKTFQQGVLQY